MKINESYTKTYKQKLDELFDDYNINGMIELDDKAPLLDNAYEVEKYINKNSNENDDITYKHKKLVKDIETMQVREILCVCKAMKDEGANIDMPSPDIAETLSINDVIALINEQKINNQQKLELNVMIEILNSGETIDCTLIN